MQQKSKELIPEQVLYLGRWVDKQHFAAFVYNSKDEQRLAKTYDEFISLIASGLWFESKEVAAVVAPVADVAAVVAPVSPVVVPVQASEVIAQEPIVSVPVETSKPEVAPQEFGKPPVSLNKFKSDKNIGK